MAKRREVDAAWDRMAALLGRSRGELGPSLAEAQQWFDAAPDLLLPALFVRSIIAQAVEGRAQQLQRAACRRWQDDLVFSADALAWSDVGWAGSARVVSLYGEPLCGEAATVVRSDVVDADRVVGPSPECEWDAGRAPADSTVYHVWSDWRDWARTDFRTVRQGTLRSDVCLDGRELDVHEFVIRHELWCDGADQEWEGRARIGDN